MVDVTIEAEVAQRSQPQLMLVKLQSPTWELNFRATSQDLANLQAIRDAVWVERQALHIGRSAGASVHWTASGDSVTVMIGHDDETWDIAIEMPIAAVDEIVARAAQVCSG